MIILSKRPSKNRKIASEGSRVFATYRTVGESCPTTCNMHPDNPTADQTCYARKGRTAIHARRAAIDTSDGEQCAAWLRELPERAQVRMHVSGDFYRDDQIDWDYLRPIITAVAERPDLSIWTYTHGTAEDATAIARACPSNMVVNWSAPSITAALNYIGPAVVIADMRNERVRGVVQCPEQTHGIPCSDCRLCAKDRLAVVAFVPH